MARALSVHYTFFDGVEWQSRRLTESMLGDFKPYACGATRNCVIFLYSDNTANNELKARISADDGNTWTDPIVVDTVDDTDTICWVSFVQPADYYPGDNARFFYGYYRTEDGISGKRYQNKIRWIELEIGGIAECPADVDGDNIANIGDLFAILAAWGPCFECAEDINRDGFVDIDDILEALANWGRCR